MTERTYTADEVDAIKQALLTATPLDETASLAAPVQEPSIPEKWERRTVIGFDALVEALDYAERKGFMPDYIADAWEGFNYLAAEKHAQPAAQSADPDPLHLSRILHELAGAASMCWTPRPTGVFDSQEAIKHVVAAIDEIRARYQPQPAAQRQWRGLTDEEVEDIVEYCEGICWGVAEAIEAKLKEKNT